MKNRRFFNNKLSLVAALMMAGMLVACGSKDGKSANSQVKEEKSMDASSNNGPLKTSNTTLLDAKVDSTKFIKDEDGNDLVEVTVKFTYKGQAGSIQPVRYYQPVAFQNGVTTFKYKEADSVTWIDEKGVEKKSLSANESAKITYTFPLYDDSDVTFALLNNDDISICYLCKTIENNNRASDNGISANSDIKFVGSSIDSADPKKCYVDIEIPNTTDHLIKCDESVVKGYLFQDGVECAESTFLVQEKSGCDINAATDYILPGYAKVVRLAYTIKNDNDLVYVAQDGNGVQIFKENIGLSGNTAGATHDNSESSFVATGKSVDNGFITISGTFYCANEPFAAMSDLFSISAYQDEEELSFSSDGSDIDDPILNGYFSDVAIKYELLNNGDEVKLVIKNVKTGKEVYSEIYGL